jgi:uncharacterized integral membrane protein (TIGR00698 family)
MKTSIENNNDPITDSYIRPTRVVTPLPSAGLAQHSIQGLLLADETSQRLPASSSTAASVRVGQVEAGISLGKSSRWLDSRMVFFLGLLVAATGFVSPPVALVAGIAFGFTVDHPYRAESSALAKLLLQVSVVALGFGMNLHAVIHAGSSGFLYTACSISAAMALGLLLGKLLKVGGKASYLITAGTAICGGSAIAAIAPITNPSEEEISIAMGTVFLLNSVALLIFPAIGSALHLSQNQFGLWAALAIHDTSSVVGAAAKYGNQALAVGTTVKLARALWIVPVSLITVAFVARSSASQNATRQTGLSADADSTHVAKRMSIKIPWFIFYFCMAAAASTYIPRFAHTYSELHTIGKSGLVATLFLIGTSLSQKTLRQVGVRPLVQGIVLWIVVATGSLFFIYNRFISI